MLRPRDTYEQWEVDGILEDKLKVIQEMVSKRIIQKEIAKFIGMSERSLVHLNKEVFIFMVKKIICIAVMFLMSFGLCACDAGRPFLIDLEYEESPYDVSDVTLKFSYGVKKSMIKEGLNDHGRYVYGDAHLFFTKTAILVTYEGTVGEPFDYSSSDIFLIKTISREEFFSDEYLQSNINGESASFNHSEMITVPQELFSKKSGTIYFYFRIDRSEGGGQTDSINYIFFDYEFAEDKVIITNVKLNR